MRHGIRWSRRHPVLGRVAGPVLDPTRGEALSVTMMGVLLVFVFWGLIMLLFLSPFSSQPQALDQAVMNLALALRNHLADPVMVAISQLSRWPVSIFSALALLSQLVPRSPRWVWQIHPIRLPAEGRADPPTARSSSDDR